MCRPTCRRVEAALNVHGRLPPVRVQGYRETGVAHAEPPYRIAHLLDVKPVIHHKLVERTLILHFNGPALPMSKEPPGFSVHVLSLVRHRAIFLLMGRT